MRKKRKEDLYSQAKEAYLKEGSVTVVAKSFNIDRGKFALYLKSCNIEIVNKQNEIKFDNTIFDTIDSEEKAYWLGFIFADGYVSDDNNFELSLALKDKEHLIKFTEFLKHPKGVTVDSYRCRFYVRDKHLKQILSSYGCVPRKSLILKFPTNIPKEMIQHFIRGYFDGDGCFYHRNNRHGNKELVFNLLGTKEFLEVCQNYIETFSISRKSKSISNTYSIGASCKKALKIGDYLYKDSTIFLKRKYDKYSKFAVLSSNV